MARADRGEARVAMALSEFTTAPLFLDPRHNIVYNQYDMWIIHWCAISAMG
jgi:hypothetical protein